MKDQNRMQKIIAILCIIGNFPAAVGFISKSYTDKMIDVFLLASGVALYIICIIAVVMAVMKSFGKYSRYILWLVYGLFLSLLLIKSFNIPALQNSFLSWYAKMIGSSSLLLPGFHLYFQIWKAEKTPEYIS